MHWFTATNQSSLERDAFFDLLRVTVLSLRQHTRLTLNLVYCGAECERLEWLRGQGVEIHFAEVELQEPLAAYYQEAQPVTPMEIRAGAYLKTQIPRVVRRLGLPDEYVVYTDCDVLFTRDVDFTQYRPRWLAMFGGKTGGRTRLRIGGEWHFNSGVIVMNVPAMVQEADRFNEFVASNGNGCRRPAGLPFMQKNLFMSDQVALNLFYRRRIDLLPETLNWNPERGHNPEAGIIHFNGLKWTDWDQFQSGDMLEFRLEKFARQVDASNGAYEYYVNMARQTLAEVHP